MTDPHSWTRKKDPRLINPDFYKIADKYVPQIPGWRITKRNADLLKRQFKLDTSNPDIKAVVNIYTNGTVHVSCSPKIHGNEFDEIVDKVKNLCAGIDKHLNKSDLKDDEIEIPGLV